MEYSQPKIKSENASLSKINITICHDFFDTLPYLVICLITLQHRTTGNRPWHYCVFLESTKHRYPGKQRLRQTRDLKKKKKDM